MTEGNGNVQPAGEGLSDQEMVEQVEKTTSSDLQAEAAFQAESGGARDDREASKSADLQDELDGERRQERRPAE